MLTIIKMFADQGMAWHGVMEIKNQNADLYKIEDKEISGLPVNDNKWDNKLITKSQLQLVGTRRSFRYNKFK